MWRKGTSEPAVCDPRIGACPGPVRYSRREARTSRVRACRIQLKSRGFPPKLFLKKNKKQTRYTTLNPPYILVVVAPGCHICSYNRTSFKKNKKQTQNAATNHPPNTKQEQKKKSTTGMCFYVVAGYIFSLTPLPPLSKRHPNKL